MDPHSINIYQDSVGPVDEEIAFLRYKLTKLLGQA